MKTLFVCLLTLLLLTRLSFSKEPIKIALIDTGLDITDLRFSSHICPEIGKDFTGTGLNDNLGHGSHIAGIIEQYAKGKKYCFIVLKYFNSYTQDETKTHDYLIKLYQYLTELKPDIVNYSGGGGKFIEEETLAIQNLKNTKFFVAAGNKDEDIDINHYYPASLDLPNVFAIASLDGDKKASYSNYGKKVIWKQGTDILSTVPYSVDRSGLLFMSGTSQATARATADFINDNY